MPAIVINDPQFTTPYPSFSSDTEVCIQIILRYVSIANELKGLGYLDTIPASACISDPVYWRFEQVSCVSIGNVLYVRTNATAGCMDQLCDCTSRAAPSCAPDIRLW